MRTAEINCKSESTLGAILAAGAQVGDPKAQPGETDHQPDDGTQAATASDPPQVRLQLLPRTSHNPVKPQFVDQMLDDGGDNTFTARPAVSIIIIEQASPSGTVTPADASALEEMMIIQN